jgi:hypothetical protein
MLIGTGQVQMTMNSLNVPEFQWRGQPRLFKKKARYH